MKSVVIVSLVTFALFFGVILASTGLLESALKISLPGSGKTENEVEYAAERVKANLDTERDRIQVASEHMLALQGSFAIEDQVLVAQQAKIHEMITELAKAQESFSQEREQSMSKLAKVYGSMKPAKAAPILETLDPGIVLEIMTRMKDRQAAKVMSFMNPALASEISERMSLKGESI